MGISIGSVQQDRGAAVRPLAEASGVTADGKRVQRGSSKRDREA